MNGAPPIGTNTPPTPARLRRWAVALAAVVVLGLAPGLLLVKGAAMLARDGHERRGSVIYGGTEARWAGVGLILWAAALPAYGWFEWRRPHRSRRAAVIAAMPFCLLLTAGAACKGVALVHREARQEQERRDFLRSITPGAAGAGHWEGRPPTAPSLDANLQSGRGGPCAATA